jgi:phosphatidylserine/phosphatidylglycerophosphate/cardiolipin synthase-like enzyme
MRILAILYLFSCVCALGEIVEVTPILTTPEDPRYFQWALRVIQGAREEVLVMLSDCRRYSWDSPANELTTALATVGTRGVSVRVLLERGKQPAPEAEAAFAYLVERGVEVRWDNPEVTLHAKLLLIDREFVLLGSSPWTYNGLFGSVQVDLLVRSRNVARAFWEFFELVWEGRLDVETALGRPKIPALVPVPDLPEGGLSHLVLAQELLADAEAQVGLMLYKLRYYPQYPMSPSNELLSELVGAVARGARVRVLLEGGEEYTDTNFVSETREVATYLLLHGVQVRFDSPGSTLHAKLLVVDEKDLIVSSANWSYYSLVKNVEAGITLVNVPALGEVLQEFFDILWERSRELP